MDLNTVINCILLTSSFFSPVEVRKCPEFTLESKRVSHHFFRNNLYLYKPKLPRLLTYKFTPYCEICARKISDYEYDDDILILPLGNLCRNCKSIPPSDDTFGPVYNFSFVVPTPSQHCPASSEVYNVTSDGSYILLHRNTAFSKEFRYTISKCHDPYILLHITELGFVDEILDRITSSIGTIFRTIVTELTHIFGGPIHAVLVTIPHAFLSLVHYISSVIEYLLFDVGLANALLITIAFWFKFPWMQATLCALLVIYVTKLNVLFH
ncbi:hypothetical protein [Blueberry necrotic ring blotch virus]|uniref:Uncharacterized protein n=1 Tax=Blueberry necrotic ring blotch virus TaxID=1094249 RepID=G5DFC9_9VIRU|nr:hypothetical protein [Blueberry necrotic ring blotch virus]AEQ55302.1 hypothetical protein [Blueberry necrotic ring blotch virus]